MSTKNIMPDPSKYKTVVYGQSRGIVQLRTGELLEVTAKTSITPELLAKGAPTQSQINEWFQRLATEASRAIKMAQ